MQTLRKFQDSRQARRQQLTRLMPVLQFLLLFLLTGRVAAWSHNGSCFLFRGAEVSITSLQKTSSLPEPKIIYQRILHQPQFAANLRMDLEQIGGVSTANAVPPTPDLHPGGTQAVGAVAVPPQNVVEEGPQASAKGEEKQAVKDINHERKIIFCIGIMLGFWVPPLWRWLTIRDLPFFLKPFFKNLFL